MVESLCYDVSRLPFYAIRDYAGGAELYRSWEKLEYRLKECA